MIKWRYARASDIDAYYGSRPKTSLKAVVVLMDGEPVGVIGVSRELDTGLFFSEHKEVLVPYLSRMPVLRAIQAARDLIKAYPKPVYAATATEQGHKALKRFGFTPIDEERYIWNSQRQD